MRGRAVEDSVRAEYFAEEVRRELIEAYGNESVLQDGYAVRTSLDPTLQEYAEKALRDALIEFDQTKTGYRGPVTHMANITTWGRSAWRNADAARRRRLAPGGGAGSEAG